MNANKVSGAVADCWMKIHEALGPGLLESVYQRILSYELRKADFEVETEVPISVEWDGKKIDEGYRADLIVNQQMLVELKSVGGFKRLAQRGVVRKRCHLGFDSRDICVGDD